MKKVLVVGGAGYLGGAITQHIDKYDMTVYDNLLYEDSYRKNVNFVYGDVRDTEKLSKILKDFDFVVWLAAIVGDGACQLNPELTVEVNEKSVEWLSRNYDGRIVFTSTCSVYGMQKGILTEESPTNPLSLYASTKLKAENFLKNKNSLILRLGTLFGVSDTYSRIRFDLVVNTLTVKAYSLGELHVFGGEQYRPLIHVEDVADIIVNNIEGSCRGIYNLHHVNMKMIDLALKVQSYFPNCKLVQTDMPFEDTRNYRVSGDKARKELNCMSNERTVDYGICQIKELLETGRIKNVNNDRFYNQIYLKGKV